MNYVFKVLEKHIRRTKERIDFWEGVGGCSEQIIENHKILVALVTYLELLKGVNRQASEMHRDLIEGTPMKDGKQPLGLMAFEEDFK